MKKIYAHSNKKTLGKKKFFLNFVRNLSNPNITKLIHEKVLDWLNTPDNNPAYSKTNMPRLSSEEVQILTRFLKISCSTEAIHYWMSIYARKGLAYYSISPQIEGPILSVCRFTDPVYAHYRSMSYLFERALQINYPQSKLEQDIIRGYFCSRFDPNGGRHKVNSHPNLNILPVTPAIGGDQPKALGTALSFYLSHLLNLKSKEYIYPQDSICIMSCGDGSIDHPGMLSMLNLSKSYQFRNVPLPLMIVILDNGIAISNTRKEASYKSLRHWGFKQYYADSANLLSVHKAAQFCQTYVREFKKPAILSVKTYRMHGHSADKPFENHSPENIKRLHSNNPLISLMRLGVDLKLWKKSDCRDIYLSSFERIFWLARNLVKEPKLSPKKIIQPIVNISAEDFYLSIMRFVKKNNSLFLTMNQVLNELLRFILLNYKNTILYGQDISPGHYLVTENLQQEFPYQVFTFPVDELGMAGIANGLVWNNILPIVEFSDKGYFYDGGLQQYHSSYMQRFLGGILPPKGMIFRMPGLGLVKGGPAHNENHFPEMGIPQAKVFCPGTPYSAALSFMLAYRMARFAGQAVVFNEPARQYFLQPKDYPGDSVKLFQYPARFDFDYGDFLGYRYNTSGKLQVLQQEQLVCGKNHDDFRLYGFGNGIEMALNAAFRLQRKFAITVTVIEYPCLIPTVLLINSFSFTRHALLIDECRPSCAPSYTIFKALSERQEVDLNKIKLLTSEDSFSPSGPAQKYHYLSTEKIIQHCASRIKI